MSFFTAYLLDCATYGVLLGAWFALAVAMFETVISMFNE